MCKYCEENVTELQNEDIGCSSIPIFGNYTELTVEVFLTGEEETKLAIEVGNLRPINVRIDYCPMCGRKLNTD